jgi:predicted DNA-binding protein
LGLAAGQWAGFGAPPQGGLLYTALYMSSTRTQIYLTEEQRAGLDKVRKRKGKALAEVVREAVDDYLEREDVTLEEALASTFGSMPDFEVPSRGEWDRGHG